MEEPLYDYHRDQQFKHWWFLGRNRIVDTFLSKELKKKDNSIIDVGAGFGACIPVLKKYGEVDALEPYTNAHPYLKELGVKNIYECADFPTTYPDKKYDVVTFFDVVEHIEDDLRTLKIARENMLKAGGKCIITVPAYMWLWSEHDVTNMHFRRYNKKTMRKLLSDAGFKNIRISYFMTLLFPVAIMERVASWIMRHKKHDPNKGSDVFNGFFTMIFKMEAPLISKINLPYGLSLIAKAEA
jgi:2-polyprenyl-3-methyl-5-hydroxy-6-metoxy-1,4-benzoquinol methylase